MNKLSRLYVLVVVLLLTSCTASDIETKPAILGEKASMAALLSVANLSGPIEFQKYAVANWVVPLSGVLDLEHPKSIAAGIENREEPIQIFVYLIRHPEYGAFLLDSGISERFIDPKNNTDISFILKKAMNTEAIDVLTTTKSIVPKEGGLDGVFLTHIHFDHIMGLGDIDATTPVYIGPGETKSRSLGHIATQGSISRLLANVGALNEWQFSEDGLVDIFGDGSVWAISSPGHSPGSTAYLVRSKNGPQLIVGDVTHTRWGWDNGVGPGSYSQDIGNGEVSLQILKRLVSTNSLIVAHPGHQS